jgi:hypothetical protein
MQTIDLWRSKHFKTFLLWTAPMPNDELNFEATLNRAANALEHFACSLTAIEMMQARRMATAMKRACTSTSAFSTTDAASGTKAPARISEKITGGGSWGPGGEIRGLSKVVKTPQE